MPTYLLHGFRWPRPLIRIHIILQNLDDAAAEWLMAPPTTSALLLNFRHLYPHLMSSLPRLRFIEQYDPLDETSDSKSQPFAYVADVVQEVKLGADVDEIRGRGVGNEAWAALMELRDCVAPGEKVAWFVVVCGDTERWVPPGVGGGMGGGGVGWGVDGGSRNGSAYSGVGSGASVGSEEVSFVFGGCAVGGDGMAWLTCGRRGDRRRRRGLRSCLAGRRSKSLRGWFLIQAHGDTVDADSRLA